MNLADVIHSVKWSFLGRNFEHYVEDEDFEDNVMTLILRSNTRLFDYFLVADGEEIEIEEIDVQISYKVRVRFDSIDIIKDECSYTSSFEFHEVHVLEMSDHENLSDRVAAQIESDILEQRNFVLDDSMFEAVMW